MKKFLVPVAIAAMIFTSCEKYEVSEPLNLDDLPTVTVKGTLYFDQDQTDGEFNPIPNNTKVTIRVPYSDYDPNNTSGGFKVFEGKITDGSFSIEVNIPHTSVTAQIQIASFQAEVVVKNVNGEAVKETHNFVYAPISNVKLTNGAAEYDIADMPGYTKIKVGTAIDPNKDVFVPDTVITYSGKLTYLSKIDSNYNNTADTNIYTSSFSNRDVSLYFDITVTNVDGKEYKTTKTVKVESDGKYEVEIPMANEATAKFTMKSTEFFTDIRKVRDGNSKIRYRHSLSKSETALYNTNYVGKDDQFDADVVYVYPEED